MADDAEMEALLREQAEFFKSGKPPAAKVTRAKPAPLSSGAALPRRGPKDVIQCKLPVLNPDAVSQPRPAESSAVRPVAAPSVMTSIQERALRVGSPRQLPARGFPQPVHRKQLEQAARARLARQTPAASRPTGRADRKSVV